MEKPQQQTLKWFGIPYYCNGGVSRRLSALAKTHLETGDGQYILKSPEINDLKAFDAV